MARILSIAALALAVIFAGTTALAQDKSKGTAKEATVMVQNAIAHLKKVGRETAFADFDDPKGAFVDRDLYVVIYDLKGKVLAHGANSRMIGKGLIDLRDVDG